METKLETVECDETEILQNASSSVSKITATAVRLVPREGKNDAVDSVNTDITNADQNLDHCDGNSNSVSCESQSEFVDVEPLEENINPDNETYNSIMNVCSEAAQHIRQTITEVLNSRKEEETSASPSIDNGPVTLEDSLKEKLADFEQTCKLNNVPKSVNQNELQVDSNVRTLPCAAMLENESQKSDLENESQKSDLENESLKSDLESESQKSDLENESQKSDVSPEVIATVNKSKDTELDTLSSECHDVSEDAIVLEKNNDNEPSSLSSERSTPVRIERHPSCGESSDSQNSDISITQKNSIPSNNIEKSHKKSQKNTGNKKKCEKTVDQILKSLSSYSSTDEKLQALCRKHSETLDDLKSSEVRIKQSERQIVQLAREKEQLQAEHNRMVLAKSRLESLCRELQRQNKAVKEESLLRIREEEEKRKDVASKFQTTLNEISTLMQENSKKNLQLKEENSELAKKLKTLVEHYEMWEKHMEKVVHQKDLESQLAKAKQAKTNLQLKQETEKFLREKQSLLENMSDLQKKCTQLASNELQLRAELGDYTSKYEEFQTVLNKSNQVFATFKTDMETTSKKIKKLEKETNIWKQKWENSNKALLDMITDKQKRDKELVNAQQRVLTLEKLCRALQAERNELQNQVKRISPPEVSPPKVSPPEVSPPEVSPPEKSSSASSQSETPSSAKSPE